MNKDLPLDLYCRGLGHRKYVEDLPLDKTLLSFSQGGPQRQSRLRLFKSSLSCQNKNHATRA